MRKRWKWLLAGNALFVLGLICLTWTYRGQGITKENADRIKEGMTLSEVEAILGPPRDELKERLALIWHPTSDLRALTFSGLRPDGRIEKWWIGKSLAILVLFDPDSACVGSVHSEAPDVFDLAWHEKIEERWNKWLRK